jgi:hypothetical protein
VFVLHASPEVRDKLGNAVTDDEGRFVIVGLPAERLRVHLSLRGQGERGWADDDSPWPSAMAEIDLGTATPAELVARVPRIQGPGAIERTVTLALHTTAARDGQPLEGASGYAQVLRNGLWITAGDAKTDAAGRGEGRLVPGERYRVYVSGRWSPKPPRWKGREVEVVPRNGRIEVEVALEPEEG